MANLAPSCQYSGRWLREQSTFLAVMPFFSPETNASLRAHPRGGNPDQWRTPFHDLKLIQQVNFILIDATSHFTSSDAPFVKHSRMLATRSFGHQYSPLHSSKHPSRAQRRRRQHDGRGQHCSVNGKRPNFTLGFQALFSDFNHLKTICHSEPTCRGFSDRGWLGRSRREWLPVIYTSSFVSQKASAA